MNNKMAIIIYLSTITLNANRLNIPIKRHRVAEWITTPDLYNMLSTRECLQIKRHKQTKSEWMEKGIS